MSLFTETMLANLAAAAITVVVIVFPTPNAVLDRLRTDAPVLAPPNDALARLDAGNLYDQITACAARLDHATEEEVATCREVIRGLAVYWQLGPSPEPGLRSPQVETWMLAAIKLCRREWAEPRRAASSGRVSPDLCPESHGLADS